MWKISIALLLAICTTASAQSVVYVVPLVPQAVVVRPSPGPTTPFTPSGVERSMNGGVYQRRLNKVDEMNTTYLLRAKKLREVDRDVYASFSATANKMSTRRGALLRRLVFEQPYVKTGSLASDALFVSQMMRSLRQVVYMTDSQVATYWRLR